MLPSSLLPVLFLALAVAGNPVVIRDSPITVPLARHLSSTGGARSLVRRDVDRARRLVAKRSNSDFAARGIINEPVFNTGTHYTVSIGIGSPPVTYDLLVESASANTWVGANQRYIRTSTSVQTSDSVSVSYGSGSFSGDEYTDTVTITPSLVIKGQSIGVASQAKGFDGVDGVLGIGPANLTQGGVDKSKYTGSINYTPLTTTAPASHFWGINQSIRYGPSTNILSNTAGIVDTLTTLLLLATDAYDRYRAATGAVLDSATGLLRITPAQYKNLKSLFFTTNGVTYEFVPNAQLWPRSLNLDIGGKVGDIYLIVADFGTPSGEGLDFINGYTFLERFYTVFDTGNQRVGFAKTRFTSVNSN
ncbi:hypothetical protein H0H81_009203 [Sphagnurus paluster]|uniref:Peptidase A1 domain-containing protein n=1 Tax=Sphagnurus paluster TaxID=117069 RepID=A0A9P7KL59_9AGAR|nr:hypothetical protein H0H81_009203 [Sphagnurus paluster]